MALEDDIRISKVKELDRIEDEESQKLVDYVRDSLRDYTGRVINLAKINSLLNKVGEELSEDGWENLNVFIPIKASRDPNYKKYENSLLYCVMLPLTKSRKLVLRERMKIIGKYEFNKDYGLWLYLKTEDQNELRIGIIDMYMREAGMGVHPWIEEINDLLSLLYEKI